MNTTRESGNENEGLSVSLVVYRTDPQQLAQTLKSLAAAFDALKEAHPAFKLHVSLVDNGGSPDTTASVEDLRARGATCSIIAGHGNVGYGRGHNLAIEGATYRYYLVLNPDIDLDRNALVRAVDFFESHPDVGLLTPRIGDEDGSIQYLCRRYPTLLDLFVRGFLPARVRRFFTRRLARYEMRDVINDRDIVWDPPIVSGCFMLYRTNVLKQLAGFDPRYFLYFEDYDLSLRTHEVARIAYLPAMRVLHHGGGAARKGSAHIRMFVASAFRFFNRFGWKWL
ncbi:glycosyltransferase family 2 protein [Paraburkholderia phymatum]|uniref:Glycosyl transferase family 2 n=1 Tax=Paraburkholderia phymatum (strain DSM 17167 / CIP 108236 / LMG 21445 / STM815) TaxID=391038 RepID=B2JF99_PARP8|nr:glycosyltransferase family 2 protein [Paraburkholderia phymatum]ACC71467.1 glycosyl transferase family 2 [Paraburkholderia phymatum STM815]